MISSLLNLLQSLGKDDRRSPYLIDDLLKGKRLGWLVG